MPRLTGDGDTVYPCPSCDVAGGVYHRTHPTRDFDNEYVCRKCGHEWDYEPPTRHRIPRGDNATEQTHDDDGLPNHLADGMKDAIKKLRDKGIA